MSNLINGNISALLYHLYYNYSSVLSLRYIMDDTCSLSHLQLLFWPYLNFSEISLCPYCLYGGFHSFSHSSFVLAMYYLPMDWLKSKPSMQAARKDSTDVSKEHTYSLHFQGPRVSHASNQQEAGSKQYVTLKHWWTSTRLSGVKSQYPIVAQ
jgi:hypothetical protein